MSSPPPQGNVVSPPTQAKEALLRRRGGVDESKLRDRSPSLFQFNDKLLQDPSRLYQFKKFVETEYADENLLFYLDVSQWRALVAAAAKRQRADEILARYIRPDAEKLINIEARYLKDVLRMWDEGKVDVMFDIAMDEVYKLMKLDSYQRFSRSVFFQAMLTGTAVKEDALGEEVFLKFMELCTGRNQPWTPVKKKANGEVFEQSGADGCQLLKAVCEVQGRTPQELGAILSDPTLVAKWDRDCLGSHEVERFSDRFVCVYLAFKGTMLGALATDFVLAQISRELSDGTVCIITRTLPNGDELVPKKKDFVRCRMETGGWMLEQVSKDPPCTRVISIQQVEYGGKVSKKTLEAAKGRMTAILGLRAFLDSYKRANAPDDGGKVDRRRSGHY